MMTQTYINSLHAPGMADTAAWTFGRQLSVQDAAVEARTALVWRCLG
jgi:hypothetical protein